jgi:SOS-response transcriptional repressor LexA
MADTVRPTKKQRELLTFIEQFINQHGYSPSYREIMAGLNYTSVATVALHVNNLISRGHLRKRDHSARSLEVVKGGTADQEVEASTTAAALTPGKEQWFAEHVTQEHIDQLLVLTGALQILGLDETASGFMTRLDDLKSRL